LAFNVKLSGKYAYIADGDGLEIVDVSDPNNLIEVGYFDTPGWAVDLYVVGDYAYVAEDDYGIIILDVSDPSNPQEVGHYDTPGYANKIIVQGNYAYISDYNSGLRI